MGVKVAWDDLENTIIRYDLEGMWTWDDYREAVTESTVMMQSVDYPVGIIANFHADTMVPRGTGPLQQAQPQPPKVHEMPENVRVVVITGGNAFVEVTLSAFCKVYNRVEKQFISANSLEEARSIISSHRSQSA